MGLPGVDTLRVGVPGPPGHRHISRLQPPRRGEDHIGVGRSERSDLGLKKYEVPSGYHSIGLGYQPSLGQQVRHPLYTFLLDLSEMSWKTLGLRVAVGHM